MNKHWLCGTSFSSHCPHFSKGHIKSPLATLKRTVRRSRCLCRRQGGSPLSVDISMLPWIWFNRMAHLIQVTDSSKGDDSNEENIRPQSYFYPDKSWQEETDRRETEETCMCVGDVHTHTHVMPLCAVYYCNRWHIATVTRKYPVFANSIQQPAIWSV